MSIKQNLIKSIIKRLLNAPRNLYYHQLKKPLKPRWLWYEVTDRCNSHCSNCQIWQKKPTLDILSLEEIERIFKDPLFSELECIINSGGEVTMRPEIEEILIIEHKIFPKAALDFSTNGLMPERALKIINSLLEKGVRLNVGVSLDAVGDKHDEIRGVKGNFRKVDYLLKELIELKKKFKNLSLIIGQTLSPFTLPYVEELKYYTEKLGIELSIQWYNQSSFYDNLKNNKKNKSLKSNLEKGMKRVVRSLPETIHKEMWLKYLNNQPIKYQCFALNTFCVLRCDGSIAPCLSYWDDIAGNVKKKTPSEIWQSDKANLIRQKVRQCPGCLNSWAVWWSVSSSLYPRLAYYIKKPWVLVRDITNKI